jgi:cytochrome P450
MTLPEPDLSHLPGPTPGLPVFGTFFRFTGDTLSFFRQERARYGDVFRMRTVLGEGVVICAPTANRVVLVQGKAGIRNGEAWKPSLERLFPNGLMLLDGEKHKADRRIVTAAFRPGPMQGYLDDLVPLFEDALRDLDGRTSFEALPWFKALTLRIAARIFFGLELRDDLAAVNQAITDVAMAATALPVNVPFSPYRRGLKGRALLERYFHELLPGRRRDPGSDLMSRLCEARDDDGSQLTDQEIVDHLIFILMAAHDTTAITLSWMTSFLARHKDWQERVAAEGATLADRVLTLADVRGLTDTDLVLKETLRLHPPLILVPRYVVEDLEVDGQVIPAGTQVSLLLQLTHTDERVWTDPERFDPARFAAGRQEQKRCPFAYMPFGAGEHHCVGFQFAELSTKLGIALLAHRFRLESADDEPAFRAVPFKQPVDGPTIHLTLRR